MAANTRARQSVALLTVALVVFLACAVLPLVGLAKRPSWTGTDAGVLAICAGFGWLAYATWRRRRALRALARA